MAGEMIKEIMNGANEAYKTLQYVPILKNKLKREQEQYDLDTKIKKLQLQKLEGQIDPELWKMQNDALKSEVKAKKAYTDFGLSQLDMLSSKARSNVKESASVIKGVAYGQQSAMNNIMSSLGYLPEQATVGSNNTAAVGTGRVADNGFNLGSMEFDLDKSLKGEMPFKQPSKTEIFRRDTQDAVSGKITWADLARKYPDRNIDAIKERMEGYNPVEKSPDFTEGTGSIISRIRSKFSRNQAELGDREKNIIAQIKTENDIDELIERKDEAKAKGIDVDAILEYFGRR